MIIITHDACIFTYPFMNLCRARYRAYCALVAFLPLCTTAQECPNPQVAPQTRAVRAPPTAALNGIDGFTDIDASANQTELRANGDITLEGDVEVKQGERVLRAPRIDYSAAEGSLRIPGAVELSDPQLRLKGEQASVAAEGTAEFFNTEFELKARAGHGSAERIRVSSGGELTLSDVRYTTCPGPKPDWELKVGSLKIDEQTRVGTATNARVEIKGVPIFYTPYISFPVGNERKSGFLFPASASSRGGPGLSVPWYWNIAPNYDATFAPTWYSGRGAELGLELRGLTQRHRGVLNGSYLPDDQRTDSDRSFVELQTQSNFTRSLRLTTDGANVGDVDHFEDFGGSGQFSSITVLPRAVQLEYLGDEWLLGARAQNYQIIDRQIPLDDRPYTLLPQVYLQGYFPDRVYGITAAINGEYSAFTRSHAGVQQAAQRLDVAPELRLPLRGPSAFLEPAVGWRYTTYRLNEAWSTGSNGTERSPTRSLPIFSVDSGVVFERSSGRTGQRVQTLEPRILYLFVPYRNQDALPIFDTVRPDLNLIQLFSTNRYVGGDRVGDANQLAYGVTSRLLDANDGQQYLAATLGQTVRYRTPRVTLPGEIPGAYDRSDVIGELALTAYRHWNAKIGVQWDSYTQRSARSEFAFQYRPENGKVLNAGYRYRNSSVANIAGFEQADASFAWPIGTNFSSYGGLVYKLQDNSFTEQFAGLEYRSCCWNMRLVVGRSIVTRDGDYDTWFEWQFELKGLSSVGKAGSFLADKIRGYSAAF